VRLVAGHRSEYATEYAAIRSIAAKLGIATPETLRQWVRRAEVDSGQRPGVTSEEPAEIRRLRAEVRELRRANEILKAASAFFAAELDRCQPPDRTGVKKLTRPRVMRLLLPASLWWYGQIRRR